MRNFFKRKRKKSIFPPSVPKPPPQLFKLCILPPWSGFKICSVTMNGDFATNGGFVFLFFNYFG
jgi:hypothetical protein